MKYFLLAIILVHGLIHLMGFAKAFNYAQIDGLKMTISKPMGLLWLSAALLFSLSGALYYSDINSWWMPGVPAVILSQILIISSWGDAKFGTIANVIILIPLVMAYAESRPDTYKNRFQAEVTKGVNRYTTQQILTEEDIAHLPLPVQKYIIYTGSIGKEKVQNIKAVFKGGIKPKPEGDFLDFTSTQYNFFDEPTRAFYIRSSMYGLPFDGLHLYLGNEATMQIKVASLFQVVDARGPKMNEGETVTLFNDMCFLAPATLIDKNIEWETIDSLTVKAKFTNAGNTIAAILYFNDKNELIDFSSDNRYESADGIEYKNYRWTTPLKNYKEIRGRKIPSTGEAVWHKPEGAFTYIKLEIVDIEYNVSAMNN